MIDGSACTLCQALMEGKGPHLGQHSGSALLELATLHLPVGTLLLRETRDCQ